MQQEKDKIFNYLNQKATSTEQKEVEDWVLESSENQEIFDEIKRLHELSSLDVDGFSPDVNKAWNQVSESVFGSEKDNVIKMGYGFALKVAAMLTIAVGLAYFFFIDTIKENEITTVSGQIELIELVDGTKVWVNENSTFRFPEQFSSKKREVYLNGIAYFDVAKNPNKPFVIRSDKTFTQVLGTSFNLLATSQKSEVNVVSGKVALVHNADKNNKVVVVKGESAKLMNGRVRKSKTFNANALTWKTKKIVFKSSRMDEVVSVLQDYYKVKMEFDDNLSECFITSTFENKSLDEVLKVLKVIAKIEHRKQDGVYYLAGPGC